MARHTVTSERDSRKDLPPNPVLPTPRAPSPPQKKAEEAAERAAAKTAQQVARETAQKKTRMTAQKTEPSGGPARSTQLIRRPDPDERPESSGTVVPSSATTAPRIPESEVLDRPDSSMRGVVLPGSVPTALLDSEAIHAAQRLSGRIRRARLAAGLIEWIGSLAAVLLVVYAVLTVSGANPASAVTRVTGVVAPYLVTGFTDLFQPDDPNFALVLNHGSAAVFWLVAASMIGRLIRKVAV